MRNWINSANILTESAGELHNAIESVYNYVMGNTPTNHRLLSHALHASGYRETKTANRFFRAIEHVNGDPHILRLGTPQAACDTLEKAENFARWDIASGFTTPNGSSMNYSRAIMPFCGR